MELSPLLLAIIHWSPLEFVGAALAFIVLLPLGNSVSAFIDNQVQHYYERYLKK